MKKNIIIALVALVATMTMVGCNKIVSMDNIRGYEVVADNNYQVVDMDDNREPLASAIELKVPDTIGRQGTAGVVPGTLSADISAGAGFVEDFEFSYNNGEKTFSYSVSGNFAIDYEGTTVWPIHGFTLTGEFTVVSERTTPTYLQISKVEWTLRAENGAIAAQKASYHKIYEDPKDSVIVVVHDTVVVRDTLVVHDTVNHRDTITVTDTVFIHDSIITTNTVQYAIEHLYWNQNVQLINGKLYVSGTDKVTKNVYNNSVLVSTTSVNYNHRSRFRISGFNGVVFSQAVNDCDAIVNGAATINGHSFQIIWEADEIVGNVIVGGDNVTSQLVACHSTASQLCATSDGHLVIHFVDGNEEVATWSTNYTINGTTPALFPNAVGAWASDEYTTAVVTSLSQRITNVIVIEQVGSNYKYFRGVLNAGMTRADFDSVSITATEYTWLTGKIAAGYVPAIVADHNSTAEYRGAVKSEDQNSYWKLTYDIQAGTAYVMSQSAWTISGYNGRNANRGTMNATTGKLVADGVTLQIR